MRRTRTIIGVTATAAALGLLGVTAVALTGSDADTVAPTAADTPEAASPILGGEDFLDAMVQDLGLSDETEAIDLLRDQEVAAELRDEVRDLVGDAWGGSWFDQDTGELTVTVTDTDATDAVLAAGANAEVVEHGESALDEIVATLDTAGATDHAGVTGWYTDVADDTVVVNVEQGETDDATALLDAAGVDPATVRVEPVEERPELFQSEVVGGNYYRTGGFQCSVGFAVEGGFVTAGHCGDVGTTTAGPGGVVAASDFPGADMAFVEVTDGSALTPLVNDYDGGAIDVAGGEEAPVGAAVCRSGGTTGFHCGTIISTNQTVVYAEGQVDGLTHSDACAEPGDSGGSWVAGDQAQGVTSGGSGNCAGGPAQTFFQPLIPILDAYDLTLITTAGTAQGDDPADGTDED